MKIDKKVYDQLTNPGLSQDFHQWRKLLLDVFWDGFIEIEYHEIHSGRVIVAFVECNDDVREERKEEYYNRLYSEFSDRATDLFMIVPINKDAAG